jgi:ABC-type branched-subunit amino acid transport system ATPase component
MSQLRAEHLAVAYDDHEVIHDLDLDIAEGRITATSAQRMRQVDASAYTFG